MEASSLSLQISTEERQAEEPRGSMDLMAFYNLLRLYERLGKPGNYLKQLSDTSFSSYQWHKGAGLASLASTSRQQWGSASLAPFPQDQLRSFRLRPGKVSLTEVEKGPVTDIAALGELTVTAAEKEKRGSKDRKEDEKRTKKQKKDKREKGEKRKRSEEG